MAVSKVSICNMALGFCGQSRFIQSIDEDSTEAKICSLYYENARSSLLAEYPWRFATKREQLALLSGETHPMYEYVYAMPSNCVTLQMVYPGDWEDILSADDGADRSGAPFNVEFSGSDKVICTDAEAAVAFYTYDLTDPTKFPPFFVEVLAWKLACDIVVPLTGGNLSTRTQLAQFYTNYLASAMREDANESKEEPQEWGLSFIRARGSF